MLRICFLLASLFFVSGCIRSTESLCSKFPAADLKGLEGRYRLDEATYEWDVSLAEDGSLLIDRIENNKPEGTPTRSFACVVGEYLFVELEYELIGGHTEYFSQAFHMPSSKIQVAGDSSFWNKIKSFVGMGSEESSSAFVSKPQLKKGDKLRLMDWPTESSKPFQYLEVQPDGEVVFILFKHEDLNPEKTASAITEFLSSLSSTASGNGISKIQ